MDKHNLKKKIKELFITREDNGSYSLFGRYNISRDHMGSYQVTLQGENYKVEFSSLKNAVTYCVFNQHNKQKDGQRVLDLDELVSSLNFNIEQTTKMYKNANELRKDILGAKLTEAKFKKKLALKEMETYINMSKYWQMKKFEENQQKTMEQ